MTDENLAIEPRRGCGYRTVGKLYLMGEGIGYPCPSLPLPFNECECCGYTPSFYRDFQWINKSYIKHIRKPTGKSCEPECPICYGVNDQSKYGLMWVGRKFYTPEEFITEDKKLGICKAIKQKPKGLVLGETWVMVAHPQAITFEDMAEPDEISSRPGVFYAFRPTRIEMLIYQSQATPERLAELEKKGITPIIVPDEYTAHSRRTRTVKGRENIA